MRGRRALAVAGTARQDHDDVDAHGGAAALRRGPVVRDRRRAHRDRRDNAARGDRRPLRRRGRRVRRVVPALPPQVAVVTNVEPDHLDHYGTPRGRRPRRSRPSPTGSCPAACSSPAPTTPGRPRSRARARPRGRDVLTYGDRAGRRRPRRRPDVSGPGARFGLVHGGVACRLQLRVPGRAQRAQRGRGLAAGRRARVRPGVPGRRSRRLRGHPATLRDQGRRVGGVRVVDDYAHHPTKVAAVLRAVRGVSGDGRVLVSVPAAPVQPHRASSRPSSVPRSASPTRSSSSTSTAPGRTPSPV